MQHDVRMTLKFYASAMQNEGKSACSKELMDVHDAVDELIQADVELEEARQVFEEARRLNGNWSVNPLRFDHHAVAGLRKARENQRIALKRVKGTT